MPLPSTVNRVPSHTRERYNQTIRRNLEDRVRHYATHLEEIDGRLEELDREWDIERALETNASSLALTGLIVAVLWTPWFLLLTGAVLVFLLQHALQGWCPPIGLFRRLGLRTQPEIETERHALKALRGDFDGVAGDPERALRAASR